MSGSEAANAVAARPPAEPPYVLGIDGGTEAIRVALFTTTGVPVAFARAPYPTAHPHPGWAEQNPGDWWRALVAAVREMLDESGVAPDAIAGISVACTSSTVVFCDLDGTPRRPAIIWMDVRASQPAQRILETGDAALKYSGYTTVSAEWLPCKVLWVAEHQPRELEACPRICEYTDWLGFRLTGEWAASINTAAIRGYYDRNAGGWPLSLFRSVGLDGLEAKLPPRVLDMGTRLGDLTPAAAAELGLRAGTPVAVGGADAFVAMVGLNALAPGTAALITGSSHLQLTQTDTPSYGKGLFGAYTDAVLAGQYTVEGGQISTGSVLRWFRELCNGSFFGGAPSPDQYARLEEAAALLPPGAHGVQVLDHWQGNRTPYVDARSRGMIWGLSLGHGAPHIYRAIIESVCFGTEAIFQVFAQHGHTIRDVVACGGALNSPLWMKTHADVSNRVISVPRVTEAGSLGAAILAAVGAGIYSDIRSAAQNMVTIERHIEPDPAAHEAYRFYFDCYLNSYQKMAELTHRVVAHGST